MLLKEEKNAKDKKNAMMHCKHSQRYQSHSVELIFAPFLEKFPGLTFVPNQLKDIQLSESLKKNMWLVIIVFSFRQPKVPENYKILAFLIN